MDGTGVRAAATDALLAPSTAAYFNLDPRGRVELICRPSKLAQCDQVVPACCPVAQTPLMNAEGLTRMQVHCMSPHARRMCSGKLL